MYTSLRSCIMGVKKGSKVITIRVSEEVYMELKEIADKEGKSISEMARKGINLLLSSSGSDSGADSEVTEEIGERFEEIEKEQRELRSFVSGMSGRMDRADERIKLLMGAVGMDIPEW